jgi:DNA-binding MarR family transcriptional regulator
MTRDPRDANTDQKTDATAAPQPDTAALARTYRFFNEIGIIAQLATNQMQRHLPHGLTQSQFSVLNWFIRVDSQASPGRLARAFQVTPGAMTNTLNKLSEKGFITISDDPDSGRRKIVTLTADGAAAREEAISASFPLLRQFLENFDDEEITGMLPTLERIRGYLDKQRESDF